MSELIEKGKVSYSMIIQNDDALAHILSEAVSRLQKIRSANKKAGGLIVASSIEHARYIDSILREDFNQSTSIVTYREQNAQDLIPNSTAKCDTRQYQAASAISLKTIA
ncbi:hypothetical protein L9W73_13850, partial [Vibrio aestuarianus]|nr:hypothetical protein [Vibrio aestuarianus]MDE1358382.1 hypothetical protein [Vibrio aestuarianus]